MENNFIREDFTVVPALKGVDAVRELHRLAEIHIKTPALLHAIIDRVLNDHRFAIAPGGATRHHAYDGGLAEHTLQVTQHALGMVATPDDREIVCAAAIAHDYAKIFAYEKQRITDRRCERCEGRSCLANEETESCVWCATSLVKWVKTDFERLVGHVVESWALFVAQCECDGVDGDLTLNVGHAMLAHHGRREWGSPVEPRTTAAFALHAADMLSMQNAGGEDKK